MSKHAYIGTFADGTGRVVNDGTVTVYLARSATLATIYPKRGTANMGPSATSDTDSAVESAVNGQFEFYIDDGDYMPGQNFKITLSKTGYTSSTYDDIEVIS